jgi:SAM-dependent methyltransferase
MEMAHLTPGETASWHAAKRAIKSVIPASMFHRVRDLPYVVSSWYKPDEGTDRIPPLRLMFDGVRSKAAFVENGQSALRFYRDTAQISPNSAMLDIGSGIGRKTVPLLDFFTPQALYVGIDLNPVGVGWCLRHVTKINQRFMFFSVDLYNKFYAPNGAIKPRDLVLPFPDDSFDVVALWSVFTHMYPTDIDHYISEISRVLKPGGKLTASFYLMNDQAQERIDAGEASQKITHKGDQYWTTNPNIPEDLIAVGDDWLRDVLVRHGMEVSSMLYGEWSGNAVDPAIAHLNFQDIVIARRADLA